MGSQVRRNRRGRRGGGGGGSGEGKRPGRPPLKEVKINNKINELLYTENYEEATDLIFKKTYTEINKKEHLTFLIAAIDVIKRSEKEEIIDKNEFISNSLENATKYTGFRFEDEERQIITNIIKNKVIDYGGDG